MKKISLKNILKKTFKNKKKKAKVKKKVVTKKILKKTIKSKVLKIKPLKKTKQNKSNNLVINKQANLKIVKGQDQKPEIKKIKVQPSEKKEYKIKDYVVYPKHGVGQINDIKKINIGGIDVETYILKFEKDKASGMVTDQKLMLGMKK